MNDTVNDMNILIVGLNFELDYCVMILEGKQIVNRGKIIGRPRTPLCLQGIPLCRC